MRRCDIFSLFVIAGTPRVELSQLDNFNLISKPEYDMGQQVQASTEYRECWGIVIGFMYLAPNDFVDGGWQYAIWVTDVLRGIVAPVEWFEPEELRPVPVKNLGAIAGLKTSS